MNIYDIKYYVDTRDDDEQKQFRFILYTVHQR